MATLVVVTKELDGLSHELGRDWSTIGRAEGNTFHIPELSVSGRHCAVRLQDGELLVRDLGSTNGTIVEGRRISEVLLKSGATFRLGEVSLRFEASANRTSPVSPLTNIVPVAAAAKPAPPPEATPANTNSARAEPVEKCHVLFVDDSQAFLETFGELCVVLAGQSWQIHSAISADQALAVLDQQRIDLVVLDINLPMVDGLQLLGIIQRRHPGIRVAVLTGNATASLRATCLERKVDLFLEKPVASADNRAVFNMLKEVASWAPRQGFSGTLRQVGLPEVIQMECIGRRSAILEVRSPQLRGEIYIDTGAIVHAAVGTLTGERAFHQILGMGGGEFLLQPFAPPPQRTVNGSWEFLLMEAARQSDEKTALIGRNSTSVANESPAPTAPAPPVETVSPDEEFVVVATYDGQWNREG